MPQTSAVTSVSTSPSVIPLATTRTAPPTYTGAATPPLTEEQKAKQALAKAQHDKSVAKLDQTVTLIATPIAASAAAIAVGLAASSVLAGAGAFLGVAAIGALLYFLLFKPNEQDAAAREAAAELVLKKPAPTAPVIQLPTTNPVTTPMPTAPGTTPAKPDREPTVSEPPLPSFGLRSGPAYIQNKDPKQTPVQEAMQRFMKDSWASYKVKDAGGKLGVVYVSPAASGTLGEVFVSPGSRINGGMNQPSPTEAYNALRKTLKEGGKLTPELASAINLTVYGRGSPAQIKALTQALIDIEGITPEPRFSNPTDQRWAGVRALQWKYGIGVDCAGYSAQVRAEVNKLTGKARDQLVENVFKKGDGFNLKSNPRFSTVSSGKVTDNVLAGDVIRLIDRGDDFGHFMVVYESHVFTDADTSFYAHKKIDPTGALAAGPVRIYVCDSSWGANGDSSYVGAGVSRHIMFFNQTTGLWSMLVPQRGKNATPLVVATDGPYNHLVEGVYRLK